MSTFHQLDPLVQHHIVNTLGWRSLRPLQEASIPAILQGEHCLLLAPTAGGKTEAAIFPVLSRLCSSGWEGLSVLYICPLRALLNNLHGRLREYCAMVGRTCGLWHGDVSDSVKARIKRQPPDILLTTPESLEVMLISSRSEAREMLANTRIVIIDEIHAFAGDDRGWHLLSVLERVGKLAGREIQRIGLSATVGNPQELVDWMAGHCEGNRRVINPPAPSVSTGTDVQVDYVGSLENAALIISRLHRGEKRLVFCDSRSKVEQLGLALRGLGVTTYLSHSSLSAEERRAAEEAFAQAQDCVIVATSTLELGIDVGDLDRVIQIDSTHSVASFLQRIGRTGRRAGSLRNCLFLATTETALLRAAAIVSLWAQNFVEPVLPPKRPLHLFAQQIMALTLQEKGLGIRDWTRWISRLPPFSGPADESYPEVLAHLQTSNILHSDGSRFWFGDEGQTLFGRRHFMELVSVFTSAPLFMVLHGQKEIGTVDQISLAQHQPGRPAVLGLGGRSWWVDTIDWPNRAVYVVPSENEGKSRWLGAKMGLSWTVARGIREVLVNREVSPFWSSRARGKVAELRGAHDFLTAQEDVLLVDTLDNQIRWYTFAGSLPNLALADSLKTRGWPEAKSDDFSVILPGATDAESVRASLDTLTPELVRESLTIPDEYLEQLKFNECLPKVMAVRMLKDRWINMDALARVLEVKPRVVVAGSLPSQSC